jgi:hypothetical protein
MDDIIRQAIHDFRAYLQRRHHAAHTLAEDVSQVLMCYSPRVSLQLTTSNVIEWYHDSPDLGPAVANGRK